LLLVEFNRSQLLSTNYIYNLTIYDYQDHVVLTDDHYNLEQQEFLSNQIFNSFIYRLKRKSLAFKIKFLFSTNQMEYIDTIIKYCDDFYPNYSPLTCSIKSTAPNNHHLMIHMQLYNNDKPIYSLKPTNVFYRTSRTNFIKKNIYDIHKVNFDKQKKKVLSEILKICILVCKCKHHRCKRKLFCYCGK
jgi:hypothetical protein